MQGNRSGIDKLQNAPAPANSLQFLHHISIYLTENGVAEDELDAFMATMDQVFPALLENAVAWMTEAYGSLLGYITQGLGVSDGEIAALRE